MLAIARGRQQDWPSKVGRRVAQLLRTKTLRPRRPAPLVSFTFDDVPDSAARAGAAALERHGARGTFYVAAGLMGRQGEFWTHADEADVAALAARGHEIGCHTFSHPDMQELSSHETAAELARNAAALQRCAPTGSRRNFAYPYGSTALPQKQVVQRVCRSARGTREGINRSAIDLGQLLAVRLYDHLMSPDRLDRLVADAVASRGWLVFYTHDVQPHPTEHGCTAGLIEDALVAARRHGCAVATLDAALDRLEA